MSIKLSARVKKLKPSASIAAKARVRELESQGRRIIDFTIGEPDFSTPDEIVEKAIKALLAHDTHYTATAGTHALRAAICRKFERENAVHYTEENIVVGVGAKQLIFEAFAATLDDGDEVIVPAPYWVSYPDIVEVNGGVPVIAVCTEDDNFKLSPQKLEKLINPNTRWLILNSPSNPTGAVYTADELEALLDVLRDHPNISIMTDDIYEHLIYDNAQHTNPLKIDPSFANRCLLINGVSKAYAMTGWRVGYAGGPKQLINAIVKLLGQNTTCAAAVCQAAAVAALEGDFEAVVRMRNIYKRRRDIMVERLNAIDGISCRSPDGAFYVYPNVSALIGMKTPDGGTLINDLDVANYLIDAASVAVMDGTSYGLSPYLRLSFATSLENIEEGCRKIKIACEKLS